MIITSAPDHRHVKSFFIMRRFRVKFHPHPASTPPVPQCAILPYSSSPTPCNLRKPLTKQPDCVRWDSLEERNDARQAWCPPPFMSCLRQKNKRKNKQATKEKHLNTWKLNIRGRSAPSVDRNGAGGLELASLRNHREHVEASPQTPTDRAHQT